MRRYGMIGAVDLPLARLGCALTTAALLAGCARPLPPADGDAVPLPSTSPPASRPAGPGACPASGVRAEAGEVDAAMGLRALGIALVNCGDRAYRLSGYPAVRALGDDREQLDVRILHDVTRIASIPGWDAAPSAVVLQPGERADTVVVWRNTYDDIRKPPVTVPYLDVAPLAGRPALTVTPRSPLDLGSTGRIAVGPWRASRPPSAVR